LKTLLGITPQSADGSGPLSADQVQQIYQRYMGRPVQADEMQSILAAHNNAADVEKMVAASPEYQFHLNTQGNVQQVSDPMFSATPPQASAGPTAGQPFGTAPLSAKFSVSDFWNDPVVQLGYQSGLDLGTKALKNAAPLTTGLDSGAALKELTKFGTDYTGMKAGDAYSRFTNDQGNQFNRLAALAGIGQTGVGQATQSGMNTSNNVAQMLTGQGNAAGAARIAGANAWSGGLNSIANFWQSNQMLNALKNGGSGLAPWRRSAARRGWNTSNDWRM
jgi:hypothetical protein